MLELHVWGPAFSLPSIDAQCLATIAYFSLVVPRDAWVLIASSDPSIAPTNELPALKNGGTWVTRFGNITDYLRQYSGGAWDLDANLKGLEKADTAAYVQPPTAGKEAANRFLQVKLIQADNHSFSSFIESRIQPLLDLSLYVTSQNYRYHTSPSYGAILAWPDQWILPTRIHTSAKVRTEHLGLSSLDLDTVEDQRKREYSAAAAVGNIPLNFIQRPRDTVSGLLGKASQQSRFKLEALTTEAFEPLERILAGGDETKSFLAQDKPSSLDCLVLGYLSLALVPGLKSPWLYDAMHSKAPTVAHYVESMRITCFGKDPIELSQAFGLADHQPQPPHLPWQAPERPSVLKIGTTLFSTLADAIPIWRDFRTNARISQMANSPGSGLSDEDTKILSTYAKHGRSDMLLSVAAVGAGIVALAGYMFQTGLLSIVSEETLQTDVEEVDEDYVPSQSRAEDVLAAL